MRVLLTNDDGFDAPGLRTIYDHFKQSDFVKKVTVVAPEKPQSCAGVALTLHKPLRLIEVEQNYYKVNGTPADCVGLACGSILKGEVDLVVSGINEGGNLGNDVAYSGTVSAAIQATNMGIKAIAVSLHCWPDKFRNYEPAAKAALTWAHKLLKNDLPGQTFININVPNIPADRISSDAPKTKVTRLGRRVYTFDIDTRTDPRGKPYYWNCGKPVGHCNEPDTDGSAIDEGFITITPVQLDYTNHKALEDLREW